MEKPVERAIQRYLKKHFPTEVKQLDAKAPDIGGKENMLANNVAMFIYERAAYQLKAFQKETNCAAGYRAYVLLLCHSS